MLSRPLRQHTRIIACMAFLLVTCAMSSNADSENSNSAALGTAHKSQSHELVNTVAQVFSAFGTVAVALLATFGPYLRAKFYAPKLKFQINTKEPCCQTLETQQQTDGAPTKSHRIRLQITNHGRGTASSCSVYCDRIYAIRDHNSGAFELKKFLPMRFEWPNGEKQDDVIPGLNSYIQIALLAPSLSLTDSQSAATATAGEYPYKLQIAVEADGIKGRYIEVGAAKIVIPICLHTDSAKAKEKLAIEILWQGRSLSELSESNFSVSLMNAYQLKTLEGSLQ